MARWKNQPNTEKREQVVSLRMSGMTYKQIASAIGHKNESWVMTVCRENGLGGTSAWKDKRYAEMREYKAQGHSIKETAEHFGISESTIAKVCKGIERQHHLPDYNELSRLFRLSDEQVRQRLENANPGFLYVGGYSNSKSRCEMKCLKCGATLIRRYDNLIKGSCRCDNCFRQQVQETEERNAKIAREKERNREILQAEREERRILKEQERAESTRQVDCVVCGKRFETRKQNKLCCSQECSRKYANRYHDKRIAKDKRVDFGINARSLYKRDKGVCWICGGQCDLNDYITKNGYFVAGDWYPSVDHIVPICDGGEDAWENVKLAHRSCNTRRYIDEKTSRRQKSM